MHSEICVCLTLSRCKVSLQCGKEFNKRGLTRPVNSELACATRLPEVHFINPWLLGEKCKPIIVCDADKALHLYFPESLPAVVLEGLFAICSAGLTLLRKVIYFLTDLSAICLEDAAIFMTSLFAGYQKCRSDSAVFSGQIILLRPNSLQANN